MRYSLSLTLISLSALSGFAADPEIDFGRQILPILSDKCFVCHGPDADKDEVRLDSFEGATADLGGYQAIDPANPKDSELIFRIHDSDDPMPPEKAEKQLTEAEKKLLTQWVESGGEYTKHWAFQTPQKSGGEKASIDYFVREQLRESGIQPAEPAEKETLARRAALTLTGLPPEPDQLDRFLKSGNYEGLVDELLSSPRFGEHQARYWLDAVRYGDTHGLHLDNRRGIYPYRDWVVKAFNEDLPFDQFITWQLAGDLLPDPSLEQLTATGYVRMNPSTSEGGAIPAEFQAKNNFDRTENFGTIFLGMTLNCARCHTHKYDPILHREYYELLAFFNSTAESPMDGNSYTYAPILEVPGSIKNWKQWEKVQQEQDQLLQKLSARMISSDIAERALAFAEKSSGWKSQNWKISKPVPLDAPSPALTEGKQWTDVKGLPGTSGEKLPKNDQARWLSFDLTSPITQALVLKVNAGPKSELWINGTKTTLNVRNTRMEIPSGNCSIQLKLHGTDGRTKLEARIESPWAELAKVKDWSKCSSDNRLQMAGDTTASVFDGELAKEATVLAAEVRSVKQKFTTTLVAEDLPTARETKVLERGEYDQPIGESLKPNTFAVMSPFPENSPRNRLGLAQWLTDRDHPLTSRVLVNRFWQMMFGEGLVRSPEDFGVQGKQPTHPELLDWLAVGFQESGWDYKALIKRMVISSTFKQDSTFRQDIKDPDNLKLARGPSYRLDAEVIRDMGLWAGGLLRDDMGGEGVKPYQPEGMWLALAHPASNTKSYVPDTDESVFRRSLYVYWKRTSPHPMMTLFDAPSRESSCVRRSRGNTPLQSLGLLNEPQRLEMARGLARRLVESGSDNAARIDSVFQLLACRPPTEVELKACLSLLKKATARYRNDSVAAKALTQTPELADANVAELAAWTQLSSTLLASDTTILLY